VGPVGGGKGGRLGFSGKRDARPKHTEGGFHNCGEGGSTFSGVQSGPGGEKMTRKNQKV